MFVDLIAEQSEIVRLRERWDQLYESDSEAHYFLSWAFISTYMQRFEGASFVLAARAGPEGSPYVAFLPLRLRTRLDKRTGRVHNEINMAGNYAADYTGILCAPEHASRAVAALAKHLKTMNWAKLHLENLRMSERRLRLFLNALMDDRFTTQKQRRVNEVDGTDNTICPYIDLPDSWDRYLSTSVSSNTRQKLRRLLRTVEGSDEFRITVADASTVKRDIEILLGFWRAKWSTRKGQRIPTLLKSNRMLFESAFASDVLFLAILWHRDRPLGALAFFVDKVKRTMLFHMAGRDETSDLIPSGLVLHAYCIRRAIELGFRTYDFLRGNEAYKYSFGASETVISSLPRADQKRAKSQRTDRCQIGWERLQEGYRIPQGGRSDQSGGRLSAGSRCRSRAHAYPLRVRAITLRQGRPSRGGQNLRGRNGGTEFGESLDEAGAWNTRRSIAMTLRSRHSADSGAETRLGVGAILSDPEPHSTGPNGGGDGAYRGNAQLSARFERFDPCRPSTAGA